MMLTCTILCIKWRGNLKKNIIIPSIALILVSAILTFTQTFAAASGSVKSKDGKPIEGVRVILIFSEDGTKYELVTDNKGKWRKMNLRPGTWTVGFLSDGYEPKNLNVEFSAIQKNPPIDVQLDPLPESPVAQGDALYAEQKFDEALQEYQRVLAEHPDLTQLYDKIGLCYYRLNDYDNAVEYFKRMLEKEPQSQDTLINLSAIYFEQGNLDEGMRYFQLLDKKILTDSTLFYNIGILFFNNNQIELAIEYLSKSLELNPKYVEAHYQMGLVSLNKGDMEKAKASFAKVIELAPESEKAVHAKNLLEHIK
jgi:Tfp pilus assembly protein PilF